MTFTVETSATIDCFAYFILKHKEAGIVNNKFIFLFTDFYCCKSTAVVIWLQLISLDQCECFLCA